MTRTTCNDCLAEIEVPEDSMLHEIVECGDCGQRYEIIELAPTVVLQPIADIKEDGGE